MARQVHGGRRGVPKGAPEVVRGEAAAQTCLWLRWRWRPEGLEPWGNNFALDPLIPSLAEFQGDDFSPIPIPLRWVRRPSGYPRGGALGCTPTPFSSLDPRAAPEGRGSQRGRTRGHRVPCG